MMTDNRSCDRGVVNYQRADDTSEPLLARGCLGTGTLFVVTRSLILHFNTSVSSWVTLGLAAGLLRVTPFTAVSIELKLRK